MMFQQQAFVLEGVSGDLIIPMIISDFANAILEEYIEAKAEGDIPSGTVGDISIVRRAFNSLLMSMETNLRANFDECYEVTNYCGEKEIITWGLKRIREYERDVVVRDMIRSRIEGMDNMSSPI